MAAAQEALGARGGFEPGDILVIGMAPPTASATARAAGHFSHWRGRERFGRYPSHGHFSHWRGPEPGTF